MAVVYAKTGGPPVNWNSLTCKKNGILRTDVIEIDVLGCWAVVYAQDASGGLVDDGHGQALTVKEYGNWSIEESAVGPSNSVPNTAQHFHGVGSDQNDPGDSDPQPVVWPDGYPVF
jgi:hypothetical protein